MVGMRFFLWMMALVHLKLVEGFAVVSMTLKAPANCAPCIICPGFGNDARDCENISRIKIDFDHVPCLELRTTFASTIEMISKVWKYFMCHLSFRCGLLGSFDL